jgi:aminoglycoside phosphotransferase (APT) family kinase protein
MLSPADRAVAEGDPALPGLATVLDVDASARLVATLVPDAPAGTPTITYTRYKPGASCLTALQYSSDSGDEFFTLKAVGLDATEKWNKYENHRGAKCDESSRVVVRRFPADGALKGPRWLLDPSRQDEVAAALALPRTTFDVLAYKPERRLVIAAIDGVQPIAVVKCYDEHAYVDALRAHHALAGASGLPVQSASAWCERRYTIATPWIAGRILDVATDDLRCIDQAGDALAAVHNSTLDVRRAKSEVEVQRDLERIAAAIAQWSPESSDALQFVLDRLAKLREEAHAECVPIHGDFYTKQLLVGADGISLLDFDECAIADPQLDLALFAAHLERDVLRGAYTRERSTAAMTALLNGYRRRRPVDSRRLAWRTSEALLRLASHPFRHRDPDWPAATLRLVSRAAAIVDAVPQTSRPTRSPATPVPSSNHDKWSVLRSDPALRFAAALGEADNATRLLAERVTTTSPSRIVVQKTSLWRHKPGRRCLMSFDVLVDGSPERWLGKVRARGMDARASAIHHQLWSAGVPGISEPLGTLASMQMTLQRAVPGVPMLQALASGASPTAVGLTVAQALHALQRAHVSIDRSWSLDDELRLLETRAVALHAQLPLYGAQLTLLYRRLEELAAPLRSRFVRTVIHRDFYHDQVLVHEGQCTLVDLDLVTVGDPALDAGNFAAHLIELHWREQLDLQSLLACVGSFTDESVRLAHRTLSHDAIARYTMLALGRLIEIAMRHPDRIQYVPLLIGRLTDVLAECGQHPDLTALTGARAWHAA